MAGNLDLRAPSSFKVLGDNTNLSKAWEQYFKRFEYYLKATGVTKDEQKRALLLHVAGEEVQDIIETLDNTGTKYDQAVSHALDRFVLSPSTLNELGARRSKFPAILKKLSTNCQIVEFNHSFEYRNLIHF
jgi:hypothetical protein